MWRLLILLLVVLPVARGEDYRVIMWISGNSYADPAKVPLFWQRLRELGVNTAMVTGMEDPQRIIDAGFPYYVENIVNRGL